MELFQPKCARLKSFLDEFSKDNCVTIGPDDALPHRILSTYITDADVESEVLNWILEYLTVHRSPHVLSCLLAREVASKALKWDLAGYRATPPSGASQQTGAEDDDDVTEILEEDEPNTDRSQLIDTSLLGRDVYNTLHDVIKSWAQQLPERLHSAKPEVSPCCGVSLCAIRNGRRKMEDKHTVLPYLSTLYPHLPDTPQCFAAVYDGHGGSEAAHYAAAHLHHHLVTSPCYRDDPAHALREAFRQTDQDFITRCKRDRVRSGSTAVAALLRDRSLYVTWLGDSQALLVRDGTPLKVMEPHKPEREDERRRIEDAGGFVAFLGTWRVNAQLSVSRAIGDPDYKPYVSAEPDLIHIPLTGTEDYLILACDGLWDTLSYNEAVTESYNFLQLSGSGRRAELAGYLAQRAKQKGSSDNISVVVLFLKEGQVGAPKIEEKVAPLVSEEEDSMDGSSRDFSGTGSGGDKGGGGADCVDGGGGGGGEGLDGGAGGGNGQTTHLSLTPHQPRLDLRSSQSKLSTQQRGCQADQSGNLSQRRHPFKSCQTKAASHPSNSPRDITATKPDDVTYILLDSPSVPEHFVKAFQFARKFPAKTGGISSGGNVRYYSTGSRSRCENQETESPKIKRSATLDESNPSTQSNHHLQLTSSQDVISEAGSSEIRLVTETAEKCLTARNSKGGKNLRRGKLKMDAVRRVSLDESRRASRERLSLCLAHSSNHSSPFMLSSSAAANQSGCNKYRRLIQAHEQLVPGYRYSDCSPSKTNWTVAVEIENAAAMFAE